MTPRIGQAPLIYLVAGEQSGDVLGGRLIQALRRVRPDILVAGVGGPRMEEQGLRSLFPMRELAIMGLLEVLPNVARLRRRLNETVADARALRPAAVVTIDAPGFTLRVLRRLAGAGIPRVHYVAPQVWAWREGRARRFPGLWDRLLCLLPFEPAFFGRYGLPATFVGHPVLESGADRGDGAAFRRRNGVAPDAPVLLLLPGSRPGEVARLLPVIGAALQKLADANPGLVPVVPVVPTVGDAVRAAVAGWAIRPVIVTESADKHDAYAAATVALTKSGTSTLELAMARVPMVVTYRVNPVTAAIAARLIKVRYAAIVNLLADRAVVPELLQQYGTAETLAAAVQALLSDPAARAAQIDGYAAVLDGLRAAAGLASDAAAAMVLEVAGLAGPVARVETKVIG